MDDEVGIHIVEDTSKAANPSHNNVAADEIHETSAGKVPAGEGQGSSLHSTGLSQDKSFFWKTGKVIFKIYFVLMVIIFSPFALVAASVLISLFAEIIPRRAKGTKVKDIYEKVFLFESLSEKMKWLSMISIVRLGCLALIWLVINLQVPSLKSKMVLGSLLWKWSLFGAIIFYGYPCALFALASPFTIALVVFDPLEAHDKAYFLMGLMESVSLLMYSTSVLVIWLAYFYTERGLRQNPETLYKYVTWTLVSFLVGAILGLVKALVVLQWRAKAIYRRFKPRILMAGFQLYFLCIVVSKLARLSLLPWRYQELMFEVAPKLIKDERQTHMTANKKRRSIQDYFLTTSISLPQLSRIADNLASLAQVLREDDYVDEVEQICREKISNKGQVIDEKYIVGLFEKLYEVEAEADADAEVEAEAEADAKADAESPLEKSAHSGWLLQSILSRHRATPKKKSLGDHVSDELMKDGASLLLEEVKARQLSDDINITDETLCKWMVDAHKDCLSLGYTLVDAMAVVNVLDWVLTWSIVAVVILFWLIVTGLATTAVLVTIVSPFLALTFMFGDTFKAFFQGAIFSFATHPFDVGDVCLIDEKELVVKNINILTTTFYNKDQDIVLLPNSNLVTKSITVRKPGTRTKPKHARTQADDSPRHVSPVPAAASSD